jgi:hypothetical protein
MWTVSHVTHKAAPVSLERSLDFSHGGHPPDGRHVVYNVFRPGASSARWSCPKYECVAPVATIR